MFVLILQINFRCIQFVLLGLDTPCNKTRYTTLRTVLRLMDNLINMCLLLCGGINLTKIKNTLVNLFRFGNLMNTSPVDLPCLCLCSELHKGMLPVQWH